MSKFGRNDPCPCGSGRKYKKCCFDKEVTYGKPMERDTDIVPIDAVGDYGVPLPDKAFFENNDIHELSGVRMLYSIMLNPHLERLVNRAVRQVLIRGEEELERIKKAGDINTLIDIMKGNPDMINQIPLIEKILQDSDTAVTLILQELRKPQNDSFVELSARILHRSGVDCSEEIINIIKTGNNRRAYPIAVLSVLLGFFDNRDTEKMLWDLYHHLKKYFPHETYSDGPLLGLSEMRERHKERALLN